MANPILTADEFWLKVTKGRPGVIQDAITAAPFSFWASTDLLLYLGIFQDATNPFQLDGVASISLEIKALVGGNAPPADADALMSKTVTAASFESDDITSRAVWEARDLEVANTYHLAIQFSDLESTIAAGSYWMVISAVMDDTKRLTLAAGQITVAEDGTGPVATADAIEGSLTAAVAATTYLKPADAYSYVPFARPGTLVVGQEFGYFKALVDCRVIGVLIDNVDDLTGAALRCKVEDEADSELVAAADWVAAGATGGQVTFGSPIELSAGDELNAEVTQVGSSTAGEFLTGSWIIQPLIQ